jgi:hypothetical protein
MNYSAALLFNRLSQIAADNDRDNRRAANLEIVAARAANESARAACQDIVNALNAARAVGTCAAADYIRTR